MSELKDIIQRRLANSDFYDSMDEERKSQARIILDDIRAMREKEQDELRRMAPINGPTPDQLERFPALAQAWKEYCLIHKMTTGHTLEQGDIN